MFRSIWVCLVIFPVSAQSLDSLIQEALSNNREIAAAQKRYEAARQRPAVESALPDPMVSLGYTSNGTPRPIAGLGANPTSNGGLMISQEVPAPGKRKLRGEVAAKEADADFQQYLGVRLNVVSRLKQAWHELHHSYEAVEIMRRNQNLLSNFIKIAESRYSVGKAAQQDVFRAQTQYSIMETQIERMMQERRTKEAEINSVLNRAPGTPVPEPAATEPAPLAVTVDELLANARTGSPMLLREEKMIQRSELALDLAKRDYYPDAVVSGGYFNQGGMPSMYQFRVDFKLPAYFWRKQRAEVTGQANALVGARREYESQKQSLNATIQAEYQTAATSQKLMELYQKSVMPQASLALESSLASYETGAMDFLPVLMNFMTVVDYELNYHEEMMRYLLALDRLEEMTGMTLDR